MRGFVTGVTHGDRDAVSEYSPQKLILLSRGGEIVCRGGVSASANRGGTVVNNSHTHEFAIRDTSL